MSVPLQTAADVANEGATLQFFVQRLIGRIATTVLVQVQNCTNDGGVSPVGFVDVVPLVGQITGDGQVIPYKTVYGMPYARVQGGANAIILDPQPGDIGIAVVCSRDISAVKNSKAAAGPGSARQFNISDGIYIGGCLNGTPTQYVRFESGGIDLVSPTKITLTAPEVDIIASSKVAVTSPHITQSGDIVATGDVTGEGTSLHTHIHSGVQTGGGDTGPPV